MSTLKFYDYHFGTKNLLSQKINKSREGDTLILLNNIKIASTSIIDHQLTIDGKNKTIHLTPNITAFIIEGEHSITIKNTTIEMASHSSFIGLHQSFTGQLLLENVTFIFPKKGDYRDYASPIISEGMDYQLTLKNLETDHIQINAKEIICENTAIGNLWGAPSLLMSSHFVVKNTTLDNTTLKSSYSNMHASIMGQNLDTMGRLVLEQIDGGIMGITCESPLNTFKKEPTEKKWRKSFFNTVYQFSSEYHLSINQCGTAPTHLQLSNIFYSACSYPSVSFFEEGLLSIRDATVDLLNSELPQLTLENESQDTVLKLENINDQSEWLKKGNNALSIINSQSRLRDEIGEVLPAIDQIDQYIGLDNVKTQIKLLIANAKMNSLRRSRQLGTTSGFSQHIIFGGSAGTGKSSIARLFAKALFENGIIPSDHFVLASEPDLVAGYVGQTAQKTKNKILEARGGVLFIDEAYSLNPTNEGNSFKQEAIDQIVALADAYRNELVIILAGYTQPMEKFLKANEGLESRFKTWIEFPDYNIEELFQILDVHLQKQNVEMTEKVETQLATCFYQFWQKKTGDGQTALSGNGRTVRNFVQDLIQIRDLRLSQQLTEMITNRDLQQVISDDVLNLKNRLL